MASKKPPRTLGVRKGFNGIVVSLSLEQHSCIIKIKELLGEKSDLGIFDTSRLEERLQGVSRLDKPTFIGKRVRLKSMIAIPLTHERKQKLGWDNGDWEIVWVQPIGTIRDVRLLPRRYYVEGHGKGDYSPTMAYCQQDLPRATETGPPPEKIGHTIHLFRKLVGAWNNFPVQEIWTVMQNNENFSGVRESFKSLQEIVSFLKRYPQYFSLKDANKTAFLPNRFLEHKLNKFLGSNAVRSSQSGRVDVVHQLIDSADACRRHVGRLLGRVDQSTSLILAFGCEGIKLGKEGSQVTLLHIGTVDGEVFIFDLLATPKREDMFSTGGLKKLLEHKQIKKIMYDCRDPQAALFFQFGVVLTNVFDISDAYASIWDQCNIMSGPFRPSSPSELLQTFGLHARHKTEAFEKEINENGLFEKRPLTEEMIEYIVDDAKCWVTEVYETMNRLLSPLWRPEFEEHVERLLEESRS